MDRRNFLSSFDLTASDSERHTYRILCSLYVRKAMIRHAKITKNHYTYLEGHQTSPHHPFISNLLRSPMADSELVVKVKQHTMQFQIFSRPARMDAEGSMFLRRSNTLP